MSSFPRPTAIGLILAAMLAAGCSHNPPSSPDDGPFVTQGVTANSGGDNRGTVLYHSPSSSPRQKPDPYEPISSKWVISERQKMAWALAELDDHAHVAAVHAYPVPDPSWKGYDKDRAIAQAQRQAQFDTYLLEKYRARFCNQFHLTYDQMILIVQEGRQKNWPMPPPAVE